jgi:hypothetical protein
MNERNIKNRWDADQKAKREARQRQEEIDSDIARYGESFARIYLDDDGSLKMVHVPRELLRPILIVEQEKAS